MLRFIMQSKLVEQITLALLLLKVVAAVANGGISLRAEPPFSLSVKVEPGDQWYQCRETADSLPSNDPGSFFQYEHDTPLEVYCWDLDNTGELYLKTVQDQCFIREYYIYYDETLDITYEDALPRCPPHRPYQSWWGKPGDPSTGGDPSTDLGPCYHCPDRACESSPVDYLVLHVFCWVNGTTVNGTNQWWQNSHKSADYDKCYVPAIIFDFDQGVIYNETGSGGECPE